MSDEAEDHEQGLLDNVELRWRFRSRLRSARAEVQANLEGFGAVVYAMERVGKELNPEATGFGGCREQLVSFIADRLDLDTDDRADVERRLYVLTQSRNDLAHQGVHARHASQLAVELSLILEEALSPSWKDVRVRHVMVASPVVAAPCDRLVDVRRQMLANAFSALPVLDATDEAAPVWRLVTDQWLAGKLLGLGRKKRQGVLRKRVEVHLTSLPSATVLDPIATLGEVRLEPGHLLYVVADPKSPRHALGVVSWSDLL